MDSRRLGGAIDVLVRHFAVDAVHDVLFDRPREQERLLEDEADLLAQVAAGVVAQLDAVDADAALILVETRQQVDQRRLAAAGRADQRHRLPRLDAEGDAVEHGHVLGVGKAHVVEDDLALDAAVGPERAHVQRLAVDADDLRHAVERHQGHRHLHDEAADVADGPHDPRQHAHVGQERADGDRAVDGHRRAHGVADDQLHADDNVGRRPVDGVEQQQPPPADVAPAVGHLELLALVLLPGKGAHHAHAAQVLLQRRREFRFLFLEDLVALADLAEEVDRDAHNQRHNDNRDERQPDVERQQGGEVDNEEHDDAAEADRLFTEEAPQRVHVRCRALDQVAGWRLVMVGERQALHVIVEVVAQTADDALRGLGRPTTAHERERPLGHSQPQEPGSHPRQHTPHRLDAQHVIDKVGQQVVEHRLADGGQPNGQEGADEDGPVTGEHPPHADNATLRQR